MKSKEKKHFNITLKEDEIVTFDTDIQQSGTLLKVIATANAATINILTEASGRDDIFEMLFKETLKELKKMQEGEGDTLC
ncbi:MAG: hypothetical protein WA079_01220 [Leuconostoc falkenbergense]|uniref:hypothetical protein n=1 Tax=Leuconostoc falkenbergense TaxID=2766470 RepID=UPI003BB7A70B